MKMKSASPNEKKYAVKKEELTPYQIHIQTLVSDVLKRDAEFHNLEIGYVNGHSYYDTVLHNLFFTFKYRPVSIEKFSDGRKQYFVSTWQRGDETPIIIDSRRFEHYSACYAWELVHVETRNIVMGRS